MGRSEEGSGEKVCVWAGSSALSQWMVLGLDRPLLGVVGDPSGSQASLLLLGAQAMGLVSLLAPFYGDAPS